MSEGRRGTIRIVGGARRSRRLEVPKLSTVRPTSDMVREAIFDVLGPVRGLNVLDLFAGTGALGLEALSRGAASCVFVESDRTVASVLRVNIAALEYGPASSVLLGDYQKALRDLRGNGRSFDLLFVDPPYRMLAEVEAALLSVLPVLLSTEGVVVFEGARDSVFAAGLPRLFERVYGDTKITMVRAQRSDR